MSTLDSNSLDSVSLAMSGQDLRYYDDIRTRYSDYVQVEMNNSSSVIGVSVRNGNGENYRLCHLTSMLPTTDGNGNLQPDFGMYTEGAGLLAMIHFNRKNDTIIPNLSSDPRLKDCNVKLTMEFQDTQFSPIEGSRTLVDDVMSRRHSLSAPMPCALVGATRSAATGPLSILSATQELPIVSYGSTSNQLSNKDVYKYMGRTVPSNVGDATAVVSYFKDVLQVTNIGLLYIRDEYGTAFSSEVKRLATSASENFKIISVPYDAHASLESIQDAVDQLKDSGYNYFFGIISTPTYDSVMRVAHKRGIIGPGKFWLLSDAASHILGETFRYHSKEEKDLVEATNGVAVISLDIEQNKVFDDAWRTLDTDVALKDYFLSKHSTDLNLTMFEFSSTPTYWEYLQYDAVMALGISACEAQEEYFTGPELFDAFTRTSFEDASGRVNFDESGTRDIKKLRYKIVNVVSTRVNSRSEISFTPVDVARQVTATTWRTMNKMRYSDGSTTGPPELPPLMDNKNLIPTSILTVGLVLASLVMCMSIAWATWTMIYRNVQAVKYSQPHFLILLCLGTFVMSFSVIPMSFQEPSSPRALNVSCMSTVWLLQLGFVISFSAIFSKTSLINKLFSNNRGYRRVNVNIMRVVAPFLTFFISSVIVLLSWTMVAPMEWHRVYKASFDSYGRSVESYGECSCENCHYFLALLVGLNAAAAAFVVVENYHVSKRGPNDSNESYYISISMASVLQSMVIGVPVLLAVQQHPVANFLTRSSLVTIICCSILLPLFIPLERSRRLFLKSRTESVTFSKEDVLREQWSEVKRDLIKTGVQFQHTASTDLIENRREQISSSIFLSEYAYDERWMPQLEDLCL